MKWLLEKASQIFEQKSFDECWEHLQELLNIAEAVMLLEQGNREAGEAASLHTPGTEAALFADYLLGLIHAAERNPDTFNSATAEQQLRSLRIGQGGPTVTRELAIMQWRKGCQSRCLPTVVRAVATASSSCGHCSHLRESVLLEAIITPRALLEAKQQVYEDGLEVLIGLVNRYELINVDHYEWLLQQALKFDQSNAEARYELGCLSILPTC